MNHITNDNGQDCNSPHHNPTDCEQCNERQLYDSVTYCPKCRQYYCYEKKHHVEAPKYGGITAEICEVCTVYNNENMKNQIINKFKNTLKDFGGMNDEIARQCAIIAVELILENSQKSIPIVANSSELVCSEEYWNEVLIELKNE